MFKKVISHPIISSIISAAVIGLWSSYSEKTFSLDALIGRLLRVRDYLCADVVIARWLLILMSILLFSLVSLFVVLVVLSHMRANSWRSYVKDNFLGLKWRWKYGYSQDSISQIKPYCPECDYELEEQYISNYVELNCDLCGFEHSYGANEDVRRKIEKRIQHKLRALKEA